jgi:hypothetical protein
MYPTKFMFETIKGFSLDEVVVMIKQLEIRKDELYGELLLAASEANINKVIRLSAEIKPVEDVLNKLREMIQ